MCCRKIWNASRICVSSLRRGHANLLCIKNRCGELPVRMGSFVQRTQLWELPQSLRVCLQTKLSVLPPQRLGAYLLQTPGVLCKLLTHRERLSGVRNNNRVPFPCSQGFLWLFVRCIRQPRKNVNCLVFLTLFCIRCWMKLVSDCVPSWRRVWTSRTHLCCSLLL